MGCDQYREALSAELDGEPTGVPEAGLAGHLRGCAGCREWYGRAARVTRLARLAPAEPMPDLAPVVLAALPARRPAAAAARAALVSVAFVQALVAWSSALTGQDDMASGHLAHEVGAWNLALAVAFLAAATRPRTAEALIAPVGIFVTVLAVAAVADAAAGDLALGRLVTHLLVAAGLALLVVVGRTAPAQPGTPPAEASRPGTPAGPRPDPTPDLPVPSLPSARFDAGGTPARSAGLAGDRVAGAEGGRARDPVQEAGSAA